MFLQLQNCDNSKERNARYEAVTTMLLKIHVSLNVTLSKNLLGPLGPEYEVATVVQNIRNFLSNDTSHRRRVETSV